MGVNISKDTRQQAGIFPPQLPCLTRRHHFLGDICKNVFFTLPERVGARAIPACRARAHATNMLGMAQSHCVLLHWARVLVTQSDSFLFLSSPHSGKLTAKGASCSQENLTPQQITDLKPFPETYGWIMLALCPWMWDCPFLPLSCFQPAGVPARSQVLCKTKHSTHLRTFTYRLFCFSDKIGSSWEGPFSYASSFLCFFLENQLWSLACWWYSILI